MNDGSLWITSDIGGISILDLHSITFRNPESVQFYNITADNSKNGVSSGNIRNLLQDSFGNIWIGNYSIFDGAKMVNNILAGNDSITAEDLKELKETFHLFCFDILGLQEDNASNEEREAAFGKVVDMLLEERSKAKANKDWATSDKIRNELTALGFEITLFSVT